MKIQSIGNRHLISIGFQSCRMGPIHLTLNKENRMKKWIPIIVASLIVVGCVKKEADTTSTETTAPPATDTSAISTGAGPTTTAAEDAYPLYGILVSRDLAKNTVNIDSEDVPGKMAAMKMDYEVRDAKVDTLPPDGAKVQVTMHNQNGTYWVTEVKPRQ